MVFLKIRRCKESLLNGGGTAHACSKSAQRHGRLLAGSVEPIVALPYTDDVLRKTGAARIGNGKTEKSQGVHTGCFQESLLGRLSKGGMRPLHAISRK